MRICNYPSISLVVSAFWAVGKTSAAIDRIVGYLPTSDVSDQAMLDLDQYDIEEQLLQRRINIAKLIYEEGGHSESFAVVNLTVPAGSYAFESGSPVWGPNDDNMQITGVLLNDLVWNSKKNETITASIKYDKDAGYDHCQVGALYMFSQASLQNCFSAKGYMKIAKQGGSEASGLEMPYAYNVRTDNRNGRTLKQLIANMGIAMTDLSGGYYPDFALFQKYYGQSDYADHWIMAAANKNATKFKSGLGNADFGAIVGRFGQGEALMKGTVFLGLYMFIIGRLEKSIETCKLGCTDPTCMKSATHILDEAVAYYAGSLADHSTDNTTGVFFYAFADNRAQNFRTAGHGLNAASGNSYVNIHVVNRFKEMQSLLLKGDDASCKQADESKNEIIRLMRIPLIQSVLAYAYIRDRDELKDEDEIEKSEVKGASYSASILPYIHYCGPKNADLLYEQMAVGSLKEKVNYKEIKRALENSYSCLNITCAEVGGIWDGNKYAPDASPCGVSDEKKPGSIALISFSVIAGLVMFAYLYVRYRPRANKKELFEGNIAAVSEIN